MNTKYRTKNPRGYLPAGMTVEVISLTDTTPNDPQRRDYYVFAEDRFGDGQWILVKHPNGIIHGLVRTMEELAALGIPVEDLEEVIRTPVL